MRWTIAHIPERFAERIGADLGWSGGTGEMSDMGVPKAGTSGTLLLGDNR